MRPGMRRRWRVHWPEWVTDEPPIVVLVMGVLAWMGVGLAALIVAGVTSQIVTGGDQMNTPLNIVLVVGEAVPLAVGLIGALVFGIVWLRTHSPVRRDYVNQPDLREEYREEIQR